MKLKHFWLICYLKFVTWTGQATTEIYISWNVTFISSPVIPCPVPFIQSFFVLPSHNRDKKEEKLGDSSSSSKISSSKHIQIHIKSFQLTQPKQTQPREIKEKIEKESDSPSNLMVEEAQNFHLGPNKIENFGFFYVSISSIFHLSSVYCHSFKCTPPQLWAFGSSPMQQKLSYKKQKRITSRILNKK